MKILIVQSVDTEEQIDEAGWLELPNSVDQDEFMKEIQKEFKEAQGERVLIAYINAGFNRGCDSLFAALMRQALLANPS